VLTSFNCGHYKIVFPQDAGSFRDETTSESWNWGWSNYNRQLDNVVQYRPKELTFYRRNELVREDALQN